MLQVCWDFKDIASHFAQEGAAYLILKYQPPSHVFMVLKEAMDVIGYSLQVQYFKISLQRLVTRK